ncbi:MAG TPA: hypothetical protein VIL82_08815 [Solirubrobacteraceae bacterium]|jgi:hypothetical protein
MYVADALRSAGREVSAIARAGTPTHAKLRDRLTVLLIVTVGIDLICAVLALILERHGSSTQIKSFGSAIFWTSTQLLTVSSSIQNPVSVGGRILDVVMEAYAITVVATLAGSLGSFMVKRAEEVEAAAAAPKR